MTLQKEKFLEGTRHNAVIRLQNELSKANHHDVFCVFLNQDGKPIHHLYVGEAKSGSILMLDFREVVVESIKNQSTDLILVVNNKRNVLKKLKHDSLIEVCHFFSYLNIFVEDILYISGSIIHSTDQEFFKLQST
jgi:DNA repair protein RadC